MDGRGCYSGSGGPSTVTVRMDLTSTLTPGRGGGGSAAQAAANALYATVDIHRPSRTVTVEGPPSLRARLRQCVYHDDATGRPVFATGSSGALAETQGRLHGALRGYPLFRLWGELDRAGYRLVVAYAGTVASGQQRDTYVWRWGGGGGGGGGGATDEPSQ